jgi:mitochondrial fission protein ELM1
VLVGGDSLYFRLSKDLMEEVIDEIIKVSLQLNAEILFSTSRRTPREIDSLIKEKLSHF